MAKDIAVLRKAIKTIYTGGVVRDKLIQDTAVGVIEHHAEHHATALVNELFLALSKGDRKTAMASWLLAYASVAVNVDANTKTERPFVYDGTKVDKPEAAAEDMWYNHKPEKSIDETFDLQKAVRSLLAKAGKAGKLEHGDGDTLKALAKCVGIAESDVPTRPKAPAVAVVKVAKVKVAKVKSPTA